MRVTMESNYKLFYTVHEAEICRRLIKSMRDYDDTPENIVLEYLRAHGIYTEKRFINVTGCYARIDKTMSNDRYGDYLGQAAVAIDFFARDYEYRFFNGYFQLDQIWDGVYDKWYLFMYSEDGKRNISCEVVKNG